MNMEAYSRRHFWRTDSLVRIICLAILCLGYYEACVGILQWAGIMQSRHHSYAFTGTFYNPGPFACYLAVIAPMTAFAIKNGRHRLTKAAGFGMALLCAVLIPATLSRTAMLACAAGCAVALHDPAHRLTHKRRLLLSIAITAIICAGGAALYMAKKDSADGRLLMWKIAATAAVDAPATGVGWDNVAGAYGECQERYFASGKSSEQERTVADAPEYVFNEYLQTAIAYGPVASLLMTALIAGAIITAWRQRQFGLTGCVLAAAIVMAGSYPLQFTLFASTIAAMLAASYLTAGRIPVRIAGTAVTATALVLFLTHSPTSDVQAIFSTALNLHRAGDSRGSNRLLIPLLRKSADPMVPNIIGKNYQALAMPDSAEFYFRKGAARCPNRMYPHYLLMKLYSDPLHEERESCRREAETILTMKVKVKSPAVDDMRDEALKTLESLEKKPEIKESMRR